MLNESVKNAFSSGYDDFPQQCEGEGRKLRVDKAIVFMSSIPALSIQVESAIYRK